MAGVPVWSFDANQNAITFVPQQAPAPGSTVEVRYSEPCR